MMEEASFCEIQNMKHAKSTKKYPKSESWGDWRRFIVINVRGHASQEMRILLCIPEWEERMIHV